MHLVIQTQGNQTMSQNGSFVSDDDDVVTLEPENGNAERTGWVNVGAFAIQVQLTASGGLIVEVEPRGNEGAKVLGRLAIHHNESIIAGGGDPDA
jgi:hypothetical protein